MGMGMGGNGLSRGPVRTVNSDTSLTVHF